jgi:hypothetical protein
MGIQVPETLISGNGRFWEINLLLEATEGSNQSSSEDLASVMISPLSNMISSFFSQSSKGSVTKVI